MKTGLTQPKRWCAYPRWLFSHHSRTQQDTTPAQGKNSPCLGAQGCRPGGPDTEATPRLIFQKKMYAAAAAQRPCSKVSFTMWLYLGVISEFHSSFNSPPHTNSPDFFTKTWSEELNFQEHPMMALIRNRTWALLPTDILGAHDLVTSLSLPCSFIR